MNAETQGVHVSLFAHVLVIGAIWTLTASHNTVTTVLEIDFAVTKKEAREVTQPGPAREIRPSVRRLAARQQVSVQPLTQAPTGESAHVAPIASALTEESPPSSETARPDTAAGNAASVGLAGPVSHLPPGDVRFGAAQGPSFLYREMPVYPLVARRLGKEGRVLLKLTIDEHGRLREVEVIEGAGFGFTEAALDAVKRSTYRPAVREGRAVASRAILPIRFELKAVN